MSDYFGALLRSAGVAHAGAAGSGLATTTSAEIAIETAEAVGGAQAGAAAASQNSLEPDAQALQPTRSATAPPLPDVARPPSRADLPATPAVAPAAPPAAQGALHPAVRAALQWVAADPAAASDAADTAPPRVALPAEEQPHPLRSTDPPRTAQVARTEEPARRASNPPAARPPESARTLLAASLATAVPAQPAAAASDARLDLEPPLRRDAPQRSAELPGPQRERVEISIGSIHVRVDPPPAAPAQAVLASPQPAAPRAVPPRSAFARSRLPRY